MKTKFIQYVSNSDGSLFKRDALEEIQKYLDEGWMISNLFNTPFNSGTIMTQIILQKVEATKEQNVYAKAAKNLSTFETFGNQKDPIKDFHSWMKESLTSQN